MCLLLTWSLCGRVIEVSQKHSKWKFQHLNNEHGSMKSMIENSSQLNSVLAWFWIENNIEILDIKISFQRKFQINNRCDPKDLYLEYRFDYWNMELVSVESLEKVL